MRTADEITTQELVAAYNNRQLTNQELLDELDTTWQVVRGKTRSEAVKSQLTVIRTGGASGTWEALEEETSENQATPATNTVGAAPVATSEEVSLEVPESGSSVETDDVYEESESNQYQFSFEAIITGQKFIFGGDTRKDALRKLIVEAQQLKMKNIIITTRYDASEEDWEADESDWQEREVELREIENGGTYYITDQQSAA